MSRILSASINVLGQTFNLTGNQLTQLSYQLGAQERSSSCTITIIDPDLKISEKIFKWSKDKGGIKIPAGLRGSGYKNTGTNSPNTNPTVPSLPGNGNGGSTGTGSNAGKLEGLESLPLSFSAFLETIGWCENRGYSDKPGWANLFYNVRFGGFTFSDYSRHPDIVYCSGGLCSNAAGAFQFIGGDPGQSWEDMRKRYPKELPGSFLPKYQNIGAMLAIKTYTGRSNDAYNRIIKGTDEDIKAAAIGLSWFWASLPNAPYGQPTVSATQFLNKYKECLKKRQGSSYSLDFTYNHLHDTVNDYRIDSSSWIDCPRYNNVRLQVTIGLSSNGNEDDVYNATKWLVEKNKLEGSWCMANTTGGGKAPAWRSKNFPAANDELYQYQAIFHQAGLFVLFDKLRPIPGFSAPGNYVKPDPRLSPLHPNKIDRDSGSEGTTTPVGQGSNTTDTSAPADNPGEKLYITVTTANRTYKHTFILTDVSVNNLPVPELTIQGQSIRYSLDQSTKAENYNDVTPQELIQIIAAKYGYAVKDYTESNFSQTNYEQRYTTDLALALDVAKNNGIILSENATGDQLEIYSNNSATKIVVSDIINIEFDDNGVVDEKPQYPVRISAITSDTLLQLKPETQITLDSVYNFIPASLKNGTWVIDTINHDILSEETSIDLVKYIDVQPSFSVPGNTTGSAQTFTESQLLDKYKSAVVRLGSASGAFITSDGYILTAHHMTQDPNKTVVTADGNRMPYTIIGSDTKSDLMIVKVSVTGANFFPIAPDSKIWESDKNLASNPIYKLGHGWSSEDGRGEGGKNPKPWDITASFVRQLNYSLPVRGGSYIVVDDKTIDFANPGDSGCPWFDKWGFIVSCTSGGDRTHAQGAGRGDRAWGGETSELIKLLENYKIPYTKGVRTVNKPPTITDPGGTGNTVGNAIGQKIVAAMNQLGKFDTSPSGLGRVACAWSVNKVIRKAGLKEIGSTNPNYVPVLREDLQRGRGKLINSNNPNFFQNAQPGDIYIYMGAHHIGIFLTSNLVRSSSSSRERFDNEDPEGTLGIYPVSGWDGQFNKYPEVWRLNS